MPAYKDSVVKPPADIFPPRPAKPAYLDTTQAWMEKSQPWASHGQKRRGVWRRERQICQDAPVMGAASQRVRPVARRGRGPGDGGVARIGTARKHACRLHRRPGLRDGRARLSQQARSVRRQRSLAAHRVAARHAARGQSLPAGGPDLVMNVFVFAGLDLPWKMHGRDLMPILSRTGEAVVVPAAL